MPRLLAVCVLNHNVISQVIRHYTCYMYFQVYCLQLSVFHLASQHDSPKILFVFVCLFFSYYLDCKRVSTLKCYIIIKHYLFIIYFNHIFLAEVEDLWLKVTKMHSKRSSEFGFHSVCMFNCLFVCCLSYFT